VSRPPAAQPRKGPGLRFHLRAVLLVALGLGLTGSVVFRRPLFEGNFGVVEPGRVYRSAQPTRGLPRLIQERDLASILNLRGGSRCDGWYVSEVRAARASGVDFYDFPMSATRRPSRHELLVLIDLFGRCRYPLLIHCKQGADRTGLAVALYRMVAQGVAPEVAMRSFTIEHGHIPLAGTRHLHEPIDEYATWLAAGHRAHTPERFRAWVEHDYRSADPPGPGPAAPLASGPRDPGFDRMVGTGQPASLHRW
jgi:hypothetical protein